MVSLVMQNSLHERKGSLHQNLGGTLPRKEHGLSRRATPGGEDNTRANHLPFFQEQPSFQLGYRRAQNTILREPGLLRSRREKRFLQTIHCLRRNTQVPRLEELTERRIRSVPGRISLSRFRERTTRPLPKGRRFSGGSLFPLSPVAFHDLRTFQGRRRNPGFPR